MNKNELEKRDERKVWSKDPFEVFDDEFFRPFMSFIPFNMGRRFDNKFLSMKADVIDKDDIREISVELPGIDKSNIDIELKNGIIKVSADYNKEVEKKDGENIIYYERNHEYVSRDFEVDENVTIDDIKAKFNNGVLTIEVKKPEKAISNNKILID